MLELTELLSRVGDGSILGKPKLSVMHGLLKKVESIEGDTAEFGVYYGGTSKFIHLALPSKQHHMFDTFLGLPKPDTTIDVHEQGGFYSKIESVIDVMEPARNVHFHVGEFPESLAFVPRAKSLRFAFVHIDFDLYAGTYAAVEYTYHRMTKGGVMVFDDYKWIDTPGVTLALDQFFEDKPENMQSYEKYQTFVVKQ